MTPHATGAGVAARLRPAVVLLLVAVLAVGMTGPAFATTATTTTDPACDGTPLTDGEAAAVIQQLVVFAQTYAGGDKLPSAEELDANVDNIVQLIEYLRVQSDTLDDAQVVAVLSQLQTELVARGVPADLATQLVNGLAGLLDSDVPITPELVLETLYNVIRPYVIAQGGDGARIDAVYNFLVQLLARRGGGCPTPSPSPVPTATATPTAPETSTASPTASPAASPAPSASPASGQLARTGLGTPALLGVVAVLMIAAGLSMAAADRRAVRSARGRQEHEG